MQVPVRVVGVEFSYPTPAGAVRALDGVDLVVTTMRIKPTFDTPYVNGMAFLTGINRAETEEKILSILKD